MSFRGGRGGFGRGGLKGATWEQDEGLEAEARKIRQNKGVKIGLFLCAYLHHWSNNSNSYVGASYRRECQEAQTTYCERETPSTALEDSPRANPPRTSLHPAYKTRCGYPNHDFWRGTI